MRSFSERTWLPAVVSLVAVTIVGVGCRHHQADAWLTAGVPFSGDAGAPAPPTPDAQGNYRAPRRRLLHRQWQVVDPEGLHCRMPQAFHWRALDEPVNDRPEWNTIGERLWNEQRQNPLEWPVMKVLPPGTIVNAWGGNLGAMILLVDRRNRPWLPVWVQEGKREGHCFVRANEAFIRPEPITGRDHGSSSPAAPSRS